MLSATKVPKCQILCFDSQIEVKTLIRMTIVAAVAVAVAAVAILLLLL